MAHVWLLMCMFLPCMHAVLLTKVEETGQRYILTQVSTVHSHMQWIHKPIIYSTLFCHHVPPLWSVTVFHHCGLSLSSTTLFCHCVPPLCFCFAQGSLEGTCSDFWQMVWEQNAPGIVMLSQFKELVRWPTDMLQWPQLDTVLVYWTLYTNGHMYIHITLF